MHIPKKEELRMRKISKNQQLLINMIAATASMTINYCISFMFTPYLIRVAGGEAYGFVGLANSMVNYATIITIALNSVAGRFVTIKMHQGDKKTANQYFNSTIGANAVLGCVVALCFLPFIIRIENFLDIPSDLVSDVRRLFVFVVLNFMITIFSNVFSVTTFITNKLYLGNIGNCISSLMRVVLLISLFSIFPANIMYIGMVSCICSLFLAIYNRYLNRKLNIGLVISKKYFSLTRIKEMFVAGVWSSLTKLSQILSDGLDLLISNIGVGASAMGQLSIAYIIPTLLSSLLSMISSLFSPQQTFYYAKNDIHKVVDELKINMKMTGYFVGIILPIMVVYMGGFFSLWVPSQNTQLICHLTLLAIISVFVSGATSALNSVFLLTNSLKINSIVWFIISIIDAAIVLTLVRFTTLGVYAVAGVSKIVGSIVNLTYLPIYACHCLGISKKTFYPLICRYILCTVGNCIIFWLLSNCLPKINNWEIFFVDCIILGVVGILFNGIFFLNKKERAYLINNTLKKIFKIF